MADASDFLHFEKGADNKTEVMKRGVTRSGGQAGAAQLSDLIAGVQQVPRQMANYVKQAGLAGSLQN